MSGPEVVGALGMASITGKGWARNYASLRSLDSQIAADLVPRLWEPELEAQGSNTIRLRGLQASKEGAKDMHLQVWLCPAGVRFGSDQKRASDALARTTGRCLQIAKRLSSMHRPGRTPRRAAA
jgi:hypothetical protein